MSRRDEEEIYNEIVLKKHYEPDEFAAKLEEVAMALGGTLVTNDDGSYTVRGPKGEQVNLQIYQ